MHIIHILYCKYYVENRGIQQIKDWVSNLKEIQLVQLIYTKMELKPQTLAINW